MAAESRARSSLELAFVGRVFRPGGCATEKIGAASKDAAYANSREFWSRDPPRSRLYEVRDEPVGRQSGDLIQCPRLLEQMCRLGDDHQAFFAAQSRERLTIQLQHHRIATTDDQQCRDDHAVERRAGQGPVVLPARPRRARSMAVRLRRSGRPPLPCSLRRCRAERCPRGMRCCPIDGCNHPLAEERNIESELRRHVIDPFLLLEHMLCLVRRSTGGGRCDRR